MKKIENTALQMIAEASRCPDYGPDMVKSLMKKLDMELYEKDALKSWGFSYGNLCHNELCICNRNCSKVFGSIAISFYKKQNSGNDTN